MDGSTTAIIIIPIVTTISLALGIFTVYWADAHPRNDADAHPRKRGRDEIRTASPGITSGTLAHHIPAPRPSRHQTRHPATARCASADRWLYRLRRHSLPAKR